MDNYLLRPKYFIEVMLTAFIPAEAVQSLQNSAGRERERLDHWTQMSGFIYKAPLG